MADGDWRDVFFDAGTGDWTKNWFLDGEVSHVSTSEDGMQLMAGPEPRNNAYHVSYAAYGPEREGKGYIRGRRYMPDGRGLEGTVVQPDYFPPTTFLLPACLTNLS